MSPFEVRDKRAERRTQADALGVVAENARNLGGALWWQTQAATQRGDQVAASRAAIARSRLLATARHEGLKV